MNYNEPERRAPGPRADIPSRAMRLGDPYSWLRLTGQQDADSDQGVSGELVQNEPVGEIPLHVLLADDQLDIRELFSFVFNLQGHRITTVENGAEAVAAVQSAAITPFDVVLMDGHMPIMDGLTAIRHIRELPHGQSLPIWMFTAYDYSAEELARAGATGVLRKPILPMDLLAQLEALV